MKREDLVKFSNTQIRVVFIMVVVFMVGIGLSLTGTLEKIDPRWTSGLVMPILAGLMVVVVIGIGMRGFVGMPRCPHCKRLLSSWLLHIAIASGNCGYCGKSIEK